ncbi:MAG: hypothetical protein FWD82_07000 [Defluviitaleaceae bacterium]|nr:hypothetical protein [Defluviitaleaceae bacterium]
MKFKIIVLIMLLFAQITFAFIQVSAHNPDNPLISDTNPLTGEKIPIMFFDNNDNLVAAESLVHNQIIYIINRHGETLREYAVRQLATIQMPELPLEDGWFFDHWISYFRGRAFYLEPVYRMELRIRDADDRLISTLICEPGHTIKVFGRTGNILMQQSYFSPTSVSIPRPPSLYGYVFVDWEIRNNIGIYELHAIYDTIVFFVDPNMQPLFNITLSQEREFHIQNSDNFIVESFIVGETETIVLHPEIILDEVIFYDEEGYFTELVQRPFFHWNTVSHTDGLLIQPVFANPFNHDEPISLPIHAEVTNTTEATASAEAPRQNNNIDSIITIETDSEDNPVLNIRGVELPIEVITWGIPVIICAVIFPFVYRSAKRKKKNLDYNKPNIETN